MMVSPQFSRLRGKAPVLGAGLAEGDSLAAGEAQAPREISSATAATAVVVCFGRLAGRVRFTGFLCLETRTERRAR